MKKQSVRLAGCSAILAASLLCAPFAPALAADYMKMVQGVPGAPVGGPTGTGGNGGVGSYDAGTDRTQSYDQPSGSNNAMRSTTTGSHKSHHHRTTSDTPTGGNIPSGSNPAPENDSGSGMSNGNSHGPSQP